jgi:hypothetical protein
VPSRYQLSITLGEAFPEGPDFGVTSTKEAV